jgi:hypothetical protein
MKSINLTDQEIHIICESLLYYLEESEITQEDEKYNEEVGNLLEKFEFRM